jgi:hypothetical protein
MHHHMAKTKGVGALVALAGAEAGATGGEFGCAVLLLLS